ncbi:MAG: ClpXP protease specificity-enhancing factor [Gammaproteobacteria bacterium]|nr:ClpXP protease specificity-enhancing factor [Gammaproteobacteria bacterium]
MTSSRPYLIRALYQWIVDNGMTPYILVDADSPDLVIPREFVQDGKIVLNVAPMAVQGLILADDLITFNARFSGQSMDLSIAIGSVLAVYAKENGQGMMFGEDENGKPSPSAPSGGDKKAKKPALRVVK